MSDIGTPDAPAPDPGPTERPSAQPNIDAKSIAAARRAMQRQRKGRESVVIDPAINTTTPVGQGIRLP
ncbi:MAG: hypothetical protein LW822_10285 [Phycisphaeraceae bacterium]|jgi:hypothetical protein|nr:hypothetical protein [Phycisphaeraceae bacterium]